MMCKTFPGSKAIGAWSSQCCGPTFRRFITKKEELERLEDYQDQLKKELEAVGEHIKEFEKKQLQDHIGVEADPAFTPFPITFIDLPHKQNAELESIFII